MELGLLVTINFRRESPQSRGEGSFFYVFFRHLNLLAFAVLYLPSAYVIEIMGVNRAVTLALFVGTVGMWCTYAGKFTLGMLFISSSFPFIANAITTVSQRWYGPKGRNIATGVMLVSVSLPEGFEVVMNETFERGLQLPLPIIGTAMILLSLLFIYERPDFSPTMSEEDKIEMKRV